MAALMVYNDPGWNGNPDKILLVGSILTYTTLWVKWWLTMNTNTGKMLGRNKDNDRLAGYDLAEELGRQLIRTREKRWWKKDILNW